MKDLSAQLTECDKEEIQFIDCIQPFGTLVATSENGRIVCAAVSEGFNLTEEQLLGEKVGRLLGPDSDDIFAAITEQNAPSTPILIHNKNLDRWLTCIGYRQDSQIIFELEIVPSEPIAAPSIKFMKDGRDSLESYLSFIAENVRASTGYDRVMIYKFSQDWHGEVVAESLRGDAYSFYGHHFPASDIPAPARALFTQNWIRMIGNVDAKSIDIKSNGVKLDLTRSSLRTASNIHLDYLRNMKVAASLTLSLICDGKLWGIISCHHFSPKIMTAEARSVCTLLAKIVSARISSISAAAQVAAGQRIIIFTTNLSNHLAPGLLNKFVNDCKESLLEFIACDGFAFVTQETIVKAGQTPTDNQLRELSKLLDANGDHLIFSGEIKQTFPSLEDLQETASGFVAIKIEQNWFIWMRQEVLRSRVWAGDPNKSINKEQSTIEKLSPRSSFQAWQENVRGTSKPWQEFEIEAAGILKRVIIKSLTGAVKIDDQPNGDYLKVLSQSISRHASDLKKQFKNLDLEDSLPSSPDE